MLFNSGAFLKFFAAFLLLYYLVRGDLRARNLLIVAASWLFYAWWDPRFLALLVFSSLMDFTIGLGLDRWQAPRHRKAMVTLSIMANLAILGFFKYYGFFVQSFSESLAALGISMNLRTLEIVLPAGISFYTFQSLGYTIDVYRGDIKAARNPVHFLAFVSFFPHLVAGPIMRASRLMTQFGQTRRITLPMIQEGIWLGLWGMFKKVVLADNLAPLVEMVYAGESPSGPMVLLGTIAFGFQIYCDFSGYSDIARGTARILGFDLMHNFNLPYAATSIRDFWRRWHIGLSTWLRDYLYISLGGNRGSSARTCLNLFLTMVLGGLWHGAAWNFVLWGIWHGAGLIVNRLWNPQSREVERKLGRMFNWAVTMLFILYGWLLFRANSWEHIVSLTAAFGRFTLPAWTSSYCINLVVFTLPLIGIELWQKRSGDVLVALGLPAWARSGLQGILLIAIILFWETEKVQFIYFQF